MNFDPRQAFKVLYGLLPLERLIKLSGRKLILPFYHTVSDEPLPHISHLYPLKTRRQFEKDLDYLCRYYQPISIEELYALVEKGQQPERPCFHLTFDDGLKELYTTIAPMLEKRKIPASIFINTAFLDNKRLFYRYKVSLIIATISANPGDRQKVAELTGMESNDFLAVKQKMLALNYNQQDQINDLAAALNINFEHYLHTQQPYLSTDQVKALMQKGFSIGSHSVDHPLFEDIDMAAQKNQIQNSFAVLESQFNIKHRYFSFPFSDEGVKKDLFDWMYEQENVRLSFGVSGLKDDVSPCHLHRIPFEKGESRPADLVKGEYFYFMLKHFFGKNKINR